VALFIAPQAAWAYRPISGAMTRSLPPRLDRHDVAGMLDAEAQGRGAEEKRKFCLCS